MGDPHGPDARIESSQNGTAQNGTKKNGVAQTVTSQNGTSQNDSLAGGRIIAICGVPGVGKTTTATWITDTVGGQLLRTDVIRKELFPNPSYTAEERRRTYAELFDRAFEVVSTGEAAVLDATFARRRHRDRLRGRAVEAGVDLEFVEVDCAEPVVRDRIASREGASDADFEVYLYYRYRFEPVRGEHLTVDNSTGLAETYAQLEQYFGGVGAASAEQSAETDRPPEFELPSEAE